MINLLRSLLPGRATDEAGPPATKRINLALQGGGAHGAFTWGVLEQLLGDERLEIEGISGTSAGAVNAVMLADGLARGGRRGGAKAARRFLARRVEHRKSAAPAARSDAAAAVVHAARRQPGAGLVRRDVALFLALRRQSAQHQSAEGSDRELRRLRAGCAIRRTCRSSSRRPMCRPDGCAFFRARRSPPMRSWRPPVCRPCSALLKSTACRIGMAAISAIRSSFRSSERRRPRMCWSSRSIRWCGRRRRRRPARS